MTYHPDTHHRRSIRLKGYDYTQAGLYFVTVCTHDRLQLFGEIQDNRMIPNDGGQMVEHCWLAIPKHYPGTQLHGHVVMPNHLHGIIAISVGPNQISSLLRISVPARNGANDYSPLQTHAAQSNGTSRTIGAIVRGLKIGVTKWFRQKRSIHSVWQRNYYEHIIRNESEYLRILQYIQNNPLTWREDRYFPAGE